MTAPRFVQSARNSFSSHAILLPSRRLNSNIVWIHLSESRNSA